MPPNDIGAPIQKAQHVLQGMQNYVVPPPPAPPPEPLYMEKVLSQLNSAGDRLMGEALALEAVADRFLGPVPQEAGNGCDTPAPSSIVEHFDTVGSRLHAGVDRVQQARKRLERL